MKFTKESIVEFINSIVIDQQIPFNEFILKYDEDNWCKIFITDNTSVGVLFNVKNIEIFPIIEDDMCFWLSDTSTPDYLNEYIKHAYSIAAIFIVNITKNCKTIDWEIASKIIENRIETKEYCKEQQNKYFDELNKYIDHSIETGKRSYTEETEAIQSFYVSMINAKWNEFIKFVKENI